MKLCTICSSRYLKIFVRILHQIWSQLCICMCKKIANWLHIIGLTWIRYNLSIAILTFIVRFTLHCIYGSVELLWHYISKCKCNFWPKVSQSNAFAKYSSPSTYYKPSYCRYICLFLVGSTKNTSVINTSSYKHKPVGRSIGWQIKHENKYLPKVSAREVH